MLEMVRLFRYCHICGRFGGGKTLLAVALAVAIVRAGWAVRCISNTPLASPWRLVGEVESLHDAVDCVVIYDEAWLSLGQGVAGRNITEWLAYLRKRNQYLLMPSVLPLHRQLSAFTIERRLSLSTLGLDFWWYRWRVATGTGKVDGSYYMMAKPYMSLYDSGAQPGEWVQYEWSAGELGR